MILYADVSVGGRGSVQEEGVDVMWCKFGGPFSPVSMLKLVQEWAVEGEGRGILEWQVQGSGSSL